MTMAVESRSFSDGERIPDLYTCNGKDHSPHIEWRGLPQATRSLLVIMDDPDAPGGTFAHWGVHDIPIEVTHLDEGFTEEDAQAIGAKQVRNDFGRGGYGGPAPPPGHGEHHYGIRVLALDVDHLEVPPRADCRMLEEAARPHELSRARITGTYSR